MWFISFGNVKFRQSVQAIQTEASQFELFDRILGYTEKDLQNDTAFWSQHGEFIESNARGYGFWLWKPYIILKTLNQMSEGDCLVYADAGCKCNPAGKPLLLEWIAALHTAPNGILMFETAFREKDYTKRDLFLRLQCESLAMTFQRMGGIQFIRCCKESIEFYEELIHLMSDYHLIDNSPSVAPNYPGFKEHRHDQSCFSLLSKLRGLSCLKRQTDKLPHVPIWVVRRRG